MQIDIQDFINQRSEEYLNEIISHIEKGIPFVLYHDTQDYIVCYPAENTVQCYVNKEPNTNEILRDKNAFIDRVKLAIVVYENFESLKPKLPEPTKTIAIGFVD